MTGLGTRPGFDLPHAQEQPGDTLSLTSVHINRTIRSLRADGFIGGDRYSRCWSWIAILLHRNELLLGAVSSLAYDASQRREGGLADDVRTRIVSGQPYFY
jgi:hypothetical protein